MVVVVVVVMMMMNSAIKPHCSRSPNGQTLL
jgi:hypothetical protein